MKQPIYTGSGVALVTPFCQDGSVNYDALEKLLEFQIENGTDAVFICVTTGESPTLTHEEHTEVIRFAVKKVNHRVPVIAGTGSNDTAYAVELSQAAQEDGADGLLMVTPYYNKASQSGLVKHFTYVADRVSLPILLYNVPSRTGCNIKPETYQELSKHPNILGTKEANGDISSIAKTLALCGDDFIVYSGNDDQVLPIMALGGKGVVSVFSNILPREMHEIASACLQGDWERARHDFLNWVDVMEALFFDVNPIPVKEAMNLMGKAAGPCRLPLVEMEPKAKERMIAVLQKHGLL